MGNLGLDQHATPESRGFTLFQMIAVVVAIFGVAYFAKIPGTPPPEVVPMVYELTNGEKTRKFMSYGDPWVGYAAGGNYEVAAASESGEWVLIYAGGRNNAQVMCLRPATATEAASGFVAE